MRDDEPGPVQSEASQGSPTTMPMTRTVMQDRNPNLKKTNAFASLWSDEEEEPNTPKDDKTRGPGLQSLLQGR